MGGKPSVPESVKAMSTNKDTEFTVHVVYCSGWGYGQFY